MANFQRASNEINGQSLLNFFDESLSIYNKIVDNNYMRHNEIYSILKNLAIDFNSPLSFLDLGCGDARFLAKSLPNKIEINYLGIDLSQPSLEKAKNNLSSLQGNQRFIEADFSDILPQLINSKSNLFDIVFSSFAIHHLNFEAKERLFNNIYKLLSARGIFIMVDSFCQEGENKNDFLQRFFEDIDRNWKQLNDREKSLTKEHMYLQDWPETQTTIEKLAKQNSFDRCLQLYKDPLNFFRSLCFYKL